MRRPIPQPDYRRHITPEESQRLWVYLEAMDRAAYLWPEEPTEPLEPEDSFREDAARDEGRIR